MKDVAHISFVGGGFILPVHTPYDRELLAEHAEASAKQHGSIRLEVNRRRWTISRPNGHRERCASCSRYLNKVTYRFDGQTLCGECGRRALY